MTSPDRIRCQWPTQLGRPCRNAVKKRGKLCRRHRKRAIDKAVSCFWTSAKVAGALVGFREVATWAASFFDAKERNRFEDAWSMVSAERERPPAERQHPDGWVEKHEGALEAGLERLSDADLLEAIRRCESVERAS